MRQPREELETTTESARALTLGAEERGNGAPVKAMATDNDEAKEEAVQSGRRRRRTKDSAKNQPVLSQRQFDRRQ